MFQMTEYRWLRYRTLHASGPGQWQFFECEFDEPILLNPAELLAHALEVINDQENTNSEGWRGVEGDFVDHPPRSVLRAKIAAIENSIDALHKTCERSRAIFWEADYVYIVRTAARAYIPNPLIAPEYAIKRGFTYDREEALVFGTQEEARAVYPDNNVEVY